MARNQSLHAYIKDELLTRIRTNTYRVGEQIPTELELCKTFNASRTTVRTALNQLTLEGYLARKQGKGTYVADTKVIQTLSNTVHRYSDQVAVQGKQAEIIVIQMDVIPATDNIQKHLDVTISDPIQRTERVRKANGEPTQYEISYIPWNIAPGLTRNHAETSLFSALREEFDIHIAKTTEHIEIASADEPIRTHLNCEPELPLFYIETNTEDDAGRRIEYSTSYYRSDKTNFVIERHYPQ